MFFRNIVVYRIKPVEFALTDFDAAARPPLLPTDARAIGWKSPRQNGALVHCIKDCALVALGVEEKLLPQSVVKREAAKRADKILAEEGRKVGRKEMRDLREACAFELLQKAFVRERTTYAYFDCEKSLIVIDASSQAKAEELLEHLRRTIDGLPIRLIKTAMSPVSAMSSWMAEGEAPEGFTIDQDLELRSAENAAVRYVKHTLEGDEIRQHIATGKIVTKLGLTWGERISFVLNENLQLKRLAFLDILKEQADGQAENEDERFDIDFTLMTGEVAQLLADLLEALGGELPGAI